MTKIRVFIADDHPMMREALKAAIDDEMDMEVIGEASNGQEAVQGYQNIHPDVLIMDLFMPVKSGLEAIAEILALDPEARILAFTSSTEEEYISAAVQAGVLGYLFKDVHRSELLQAIRTVYQDSAFIPTNVAGKLLTSIRQKPSQVPVLVNTLTSREKDVLFLIGLGQSNQQIAAALCVSEGTIRTHIHHILDKLHLDNRNQAILLAINLEKQGIKLRVSG
ncbi:MAG TPA: response regulator transcription factor [Anaerolineaceae bacterium]|nr:response regulator transcription factor [Anaerolineaceae bacterium]HPN51965.1 response regulator transcription factor [Anaerolineaceae bacterium]